MRKTAIYILTVFCLAGVVTGAVLWQAGRNLNGGDPADVQESGSGEEVLKNPESADPGVVHLYFIHKNGVNLRAQTRKMPHMADPVARGVFIVENLIKGPASDLWRSVPEKTRLNALYVTPDKIACVDLTDDMARNHPGGAETEYLTIYSLVNSLILNIPEIEAVKFLINGREALTLAGHIDIRYPFYSNMLLIR